MNNSLEIQLLKLDDKAVIPTYAKDGDAAVDLTAISRDFDTKGNVVYGTGLALAIPKGYVGLGLPRSSISNKPLSLANCVATIDAGYRGEIKLKFKPAVYFTTDPDMEPFSQDESLYEVGDRVAQLLVIPRPELKFVEVDSLDETERGTGGFGSTDEIKNQTNEENKHEEKSESEEQDNKINS